jgi:hypothetical protein
VEPGGGSDRRRLASLLAGLLPSGQVRLGVRGGVLVAAGVICLLIAGGEIVNAVDTLHSATAGAGVDAGVGSNGAAARRDAIMGAVLISCRAVLAAVLTEAVLPRPLGLLRGVGNHRFVGGAVGATIGYVALCFVFSNVVAPAVVTGRRFPGSAVADATLLPRDLVLSGSAGLIEELALFAIPLALLGMSKRRWVQWAGLVLVIALRFGIHVYYGYGFAAVMVVPWMIGAWLLYRAVGSIWPLIIGHAVNDAPLVVVMRTQQTWVYTALQVTAAAGAVLLIATAARWAIRTRAAHRTSPVGSAPRQ